MHIQSYITGFTDGEGCFQVSFSKRKKMNLGIEVKPSFSLSQRKRNKDIIFFLQDFFKCGGVRFSKKDQYYKFEVRSISDLMKKIIPHFQKNPLQTSKQKDFQIFTDICQLINSGQHLNPQGLTKIIDLSQNLNASGKKKYNRKDLLKIVAR